jgi:hypothetical protein
VSYGSFFYGITAGAPIPPELPEYGLVVNVKFYGILTRKQAQRRIRKINRQLRMRSKKIQRMRGGMSAMTEFRRSPQSYFNQIGWHLKQLRTQRQIRNTIAKRWNLKRSGKKKKGGGRFLFWRKRR